MARTLKDFCLNLGNHNKMEEYKDADAFVLAVRNILLSRPGNFPLTPSLGMDIEKYTFEFADEDTELAIKTELNRQISKYVDNVSNLNIIVDIIPDESDMSDNRYILGISVAATVNGQSVTTNFALYRNHDVLNVYNETY